MTLDRGHFAALVVSALLILSGCASTFGTSDDVDREAILEGMDELESYEFELIQTVDSGFGEIEMSIEGAVDAANQEMYMSMDGAGLGMDTESYIVDDVQYTNAMGVWTQMELPETSGWQGDQVGEHEPIVEAGDLEVVDSETVNGVETTVVEIEVSEELIFEALEAIDEEFDQEVGDESVSEIYDEMDIEFDDVTYRLYVDESTDLLHKVDVEMTMEMDGQSMATQTEMIITEHNEAVDIELPAEAADAETIDDANGFGAWDDF